MPINFVLSIKSLDMKNVYIILILVFLGKVSFAGYMSDFEDDSLKKISIDNQRIKYQDKLVGKYTTKTVKLEGDKVTRFIVRFFKTEGNEIAEFNIDVLNKVKKNQEQIVDVSLSTLSDNVSHNGENFINYHQKIEIEINPEGTPQLENTIAYLIKNNYLVKN